MFTRRRDRNPELDHLLERARASGPMTQAEIDAQRRSWILGEAGFGSDADEAKYRAAVARGDQEAIDECGRETAERIEAARRILDAASESRP